MGKHTVMNHVGAQVIRLKGSARLCRESYLAQFRANVVVNEHDHDIQNAVVGDVISRPTDAVL